MKRFRLSALARCLAAVGVGISTVSAAVSLPSTLQLDVIFPRNETYQPVYPFPVVFAIHNLSAAWNFSLVFDWIIYSYPSEFEGGLESGRGGFGHDRRGSPSSAPPDTLLVVNSTQQIVNTTNTEFYLYYRFGITGNCTNDGRQGPAPQPPRTPDMITTGIVGFTISRGGGRVPDITAGGPCPHRSHAIGVEGTSTEADGDTCPVLADPAPPAQTCAFDVNAGVASKVAADMLATASCTTGTWPNVTGLVRPCGKTSAALPAVGPRLSLALAILSGMAISHLV